MVLFQIILAATLGSSTDSRVSVDWAATPDNQHIFDMSLEPSIERVLQGGQKIEGHVPKSVRNLRFFRIVMRPKNAADPFSPLKTEGRPRQEPDVDHGWQINADGDSEYLIQIRPERLRTLPNLPIEGWLDEEAGDVRHLIFFVGDDPNLPRDSRGGLGRAIGGLARNVGSAFNAPASHNTVGAAAPLSPNANRSVPFRRRDSYADSDLAPSMSDYSSRSIYNTNDLSARRTTPPVSPNPTAQDYYPRVAQGPSIPYDNHLATDYAAGRANTNGPLTRNDSLLSLQSGAANTVPIPNKASLLLTGLGLAVSLGFNAYLGWLAWTFFWRYREVASELARARTDALNTRQFA